MRPGDQIAIEIAERVAELPRTEDRLFIAVAGPPASGKSTIAAGLCEKLNAGGRSAALLGMDGFHLDNRILDARGLRSRKGSPQTFDLAGFAAILERLRNEQEVIAPRFSRKLDASIGSAVVIDASVDLIVVEGNYLLLDRPGWRDLHALWSYSVFLDVEHDVLRKRLARRWERHGFSHEEAQQKIEENDMRNAELVLGSSVAAHHLYSDSTGLISQVDELSS